MVLVGVANAVYHPADYAILGAVIEPSRLGKAFSIHTFAGFLGSAIAPILMLLGAQAFGFRAAIIAAGVLGLVVAVPLAHGRMAGSSRRLSLAGGGGPVHSDAAVADADGYRPGRLLRAAQPEQWRVDQLLGGGAGHGLRDLAVVGEPGAVGVPVRCPRSASWPAVSIADRTRRHGDVAAFGFGGAAVLILLVGTFDLGTVLLVAAMGTAGFLSGMISPSRDMLVRAASPPGAFGRVFGIVTTGFNIGGTVGPLIGGWIMDHNLPRWVFFSSVLFMAMTSIMALASDWRVAAAIVAGAFIGVDAMGLPEADAETKAWFVGVA